jgi:hypothetical protein
MSTTFFGANALLISVIEVVNTRTLFSRSLDLFKRLVNVATLT